MNRALVLLLAVVGLAAVACIGGYPGGGASGSETPASAPSGSEAVLPAVDPASGLPVVRLSDLPPEAAAVVALIDAGGPFPFRQDGAVFQNREGILPDEAMGYYHEYTVPTPGEDDRGARRIVTGEDGAMYWTGDHYDSFAWIAR